MITIGVLLAPRNDRPPKPPTALPIGRAALALATEGIEVVFGDRVHNERMSGWTAANDRWVAVEEVRISAAFDRYPCHSRPSQFAHIVSELGAVTLANPPSIVELCRDKIATQKFLGTLHAMPSVVTDPKHFETTLAHWGAAFLKPRFGAFGIGIRHVVPGDSLASSGPGSTTGSDQPLFLQRAVTAPPPWRGISVRLNTQRLPNGEWFHNPAAVRRSQDDWVVNGARGAEIVPASDTLTATTCEAITALADRVCARFAAHPDGERIAELGIDLVIDATGRPWCLEVNAKPRGRLEALASSFPDRFADAHLAATCRPLRYIALRFETPPSGPSNDR